MGWGTEMKVLLIALVFSKWPLATDTLLQESSLAGMPLSEAEYEYFFQALTAHQVLHAVCLRRAILGCHDPAIQALDRYENHGVIPDAEGPRRWVKGPMEQQERRVRAFLCLGDVKEICVISVQKGWICSDFPDNTSFPSFCDFTLYRCIVKKYFTKRVLCPDEATQRSTVTQSDQDSSTPDDVVISATERSFELPDSTPTTSTEPSAEPLATPETAAVEISAPPLLTTAGKAPLLELLSSSVIDVAAKLISQILTAFTATTKPPSESATSEPFMELTPASTATATPESSEPFMELTPTNAATATPESSEPFMELTPTNAATATPESSSELPATTAMTDGFLIELTSTDVIITEPELNLATASTVAAPTQDTATALTESVLELATATELFLESTSDTTESFFVPITHTTTTATTSDTEPCVVDYPESFSTSTDSTSSTVQHSTSSTVTTTTVTTTTGSTSILPIHLATTPTKVAAAATSSTTAASSWPFAPVFDAPLPFPPPQSNSTMRILILSFIRNKKVTNGDMAGISTLPLTALGSGSILQREEIQRPLLTNGLKDLFLRLHDKRVQELMHKMQNGISGGEQNPQSLSSSLQLLRALSPRSDFKNRLQR